MPAEVGHAEQVARLEDIVDVLADAALYRHVLATGSNQPVHGGTITCIAARVDLLQGGQFAVALAHFAAGNDICSVGSCICRRRRRCRPEAYALIL